MTSAVISPALLPRARAVLKEPVWVRPYSFEQILPRFFDARALSLRGNRREKFALSMNDSRQNMALALVLPLLSWAAKTTGEAVFLNRVRAQIEEMTRWEKLNRPGYTLYQNGPDVAPDFNDGNWLGTGWGLRALSESLEMLRDELPAALIFRVRDLMAREIADVRADFRLQRAWYWNTPVSNQFVLPLTGVLVACLTLGKTRGDDDYEWALAHLQRALDEQGSDGAMHEGTAYAALTEWELLCAARAANQAGDARLKLHPHLQNLGSWLLHLLQPGGHLVNFFDASERHLQLVGEASSLSRSDQFLACLKLCAELEHDAGAAWVLGHVLPDAAPPFWGESQREIAPSEPPTWAAFSSSPLVTWRSSWADDADGVWVRGASARDSHDHRDAGHVNLLLGGREVLIECGASSYASPHHGFYKSGAAHNTLQIGEHGAQIKGADAPIEIEHLNENGGEIALELGAQYEPHCLQSWRREVRFGRGELTIDDALILPPDAPDVPIFWFHLGETLSVSLEASENQTHWRASWNGGALDFAGDAPFEIAVERAPHGVTYQTEKMHESLRVQTLAPVTHFELQTTIFADNERAVSPSPAPRRELAFA